MTPERQKWYDSLSQEEKRVRRDIADFKTAIKNSKASLNNSAGYSGFEKCSIRYHKKSIRALRRQIAMRPIVEHLMFDYYYCPSCRRYVEEDTGYFIELSDKCCRHCGQKLRWD